MLKVPQILVRSLVLAAVVAALAGCGQKGPLIFPKEPAAVGRATLPQILRPRLLPGGAPPAAKPPAAAAPPANVAPPTPTDLVPESSFDSVTSSPSVPAP
ncbi:MAG: lipoprotein [Pseudomonadota bacterium]